MTYIDGCVLEKYYKNGNRHGSRIARLNGVKIVKDNAKYGKVHGYQYCNDPNWMSHEKFKKDNKLHDEQKYTWPDGRVEIREYENGKQKL